MKRVNHWLRCDVPGCTDEFGPAKTGRRLFSKARAAGWQTKPDICPHCQAKAAAVEVSA